MIYNNFKNSLKFSRNKNFYNSSDGILNQNPIIVTKTNAYNFNYTDINKLQLAQLLARRDLKNLREIEINSEEAVKTVKINENESSEDLSKAKPKQMRKKKTNLQEKRLSSIKRVPGPQTPNRIVTKKSMPIRSISPPTRDTDKIWRPQHQNEIYRRNGNHMDNLQIKVDQCSNKLDQLEKLLHSKSNWKNDFPLHPVNPVKSNRELAILSDKLRQLMNTKIRSQLNFDNGASNVNQLSLDLPSIPIAKQPPTIIDTLLSKLDNLTSEMDNVQSRWQRVRYENISQTFSDDESTIDSEIRFTKVRKENRFQFNELTNIDQVDDGKILLNISSKTVANLDRNRRASIDQFRFQNVSVKPFHLDWISENLIDDIVDEVVDEINEVNNQLIESILNSELDD